MSLLSKLNKLSLLALNPHVFGRHEKVFFIVSHMRSRSTVLSHVLGSNSGICGYSERFKSYSGRLDLLKMRVDLFLDSRESVQNKYLLDKILHNHLSISDSLLSAIAPKAIFLLRKPESSIKSIINMAHNTAIEELKAPQFVLDYYCSRLLELENLAERFKGNFHYVESDDLINHTDEVLNNLSLWLQLEEPLEKEYSRFTKTGKPGAGEPSQNIQSGVIQNTKPHNDIHLSLAIIEQGQLAYDQCNNKLMNLSQNTEGR